MEKNKLFSFEFWQKFGKALMVVVAVMPAAGLMICIGKLIGMTGDVALIKTIANVVEQLGWGIIRWFLGKRTCRWSICWTFSICSY